MKLMYAELSSQGPVRAKNEDYIGFWQPADIEEERTRGTVVALADGVGGHGHGDVASRLAIEVALRTFQAVKPGKSPRQILERMFRAANLAVYDQGMDHREQGRMATTLTVAIFRNNEITVGHVGDCRAYIIQEGRIRQVTADHSYAAQQYKLGLITEQEAATSELRSMLTRSLGREPIVLIDCYTLPVNRGDRLIQCSDGLYTCITAQELCEIATHAPPEDACRELVALSEKRGTDDNLSVQIVHIHRVEQLIYYRGLPIYQEAEESMSHEIEAGQVLDGRFQITGIVCRSGMATIFNAKDMQTGKVVAIKVPLMQFESDPAFFSRFQREEEIGKILRHPYLLHIEPVADKSRPYIVMELLEGQTLRQVLQGLGRMPVEHALGIASQICEALEYMHQQKVIHRDLKPENIMLCKDQSIRIMDFGIAKAAALRRITFTGFSPTMGTPDYMAPEQVKGKRGDERTDLYSLGAMLYEMLTGVPPFEGNSPYMIMNARLTGDPVAPRKRNPEIPPQVEEIILHAMERNPHDRYPSAAAMAAELNVPANVRLTGRHERLRASVPWLTHWRMVRLVGLAMLVPVVVFGLLFLLFHCALHNCSRIRQNAGKAREKPAFWRMRLQLWSWNGQPGSSRMDKSDFPLMAWLIFVGAAALEVGGDAVVRKGLRGTSVATVVAGCLMLGGYGLVVNMVKWDFSKLLGVYVAIFALISILASRFLFGEQVPVATWVGLSIIILGGLVIQFGASLPF